MPANNNSSDASIASQLTRRRAIVGGTSLLTAGGTLVWVGDPASAQAEVSVDSFAVSDATFETDALDPVVDVDVAFAYDVGTAPVASVELTLGIDGTTVTRDELVTDESVADATTTLSGRVADSAAWSLTDFAVDAGAEQTREITVALGLSVLESDGTVIASDEATDTAAIVVSNPADSTVTASVGGAGTVRDRNA